MTTRAQRSACSGVRTLAVVSPRARLMKLLPGNRGGACQVTDQGACPGSRDKAATPPVGEEHRDLAAVQPGWGDALTLCPPAQVREECQVRAQSHRAVDERAVQDRQVPAADEPPTPAARHTRCSHTPAARSGQNRSRLPHDLLGLGDRRDEPPRGEQLIAWQTSGSFNHGTASVERCRIPSSTILIMELSRKMNLS